MSDQRITSVKRVSLAGLSEQWDDECYAYVRPATYEDQLDLTKLDIGSASKDKQIEYQVSFVKDHFVSGQIKVFEDGGFTLVDMSQDDTAASVAICDKLYSEINGFDLDPKDFRKEALTAALQKTNESNTETSSSED